MADLRLDNIAKSYGYERVIEDLSLSIDDGEFIVLLGPSGCGKSTLLRMIAGLEEVTAGDLLIGGERANDIPPQQRDIAMVFQSYALFPHMSAADNIGFGPRVRGEDKAKAGQRIAVASQMLNLAPYLDRRPGQLSGGQRQRVAMGRSIVRDPKVFLFDEPLSNLDAKLRVQMRTEIKALHQKLGTTIVYVTHDQIEAMTMADRIVVMNHGRIEQVGTPLEIYDRPQNLFVAGFIGSPGMSFLPGKLVADDGGRQVAFADGSALTVPAGPVSNGRAVAVGVRPEAYMRDPEGPLAFEVEVVEPTGPEVHVFGKTAGEDIRVVFRDRMMPKVGETLRLAVPPEHVHLFDAQEGQRL